MPFPGKKARLWLVLLLVLLRPGPGRAGNCPGWLPRYDLDITLYLEHHRALVRERVTWTNRHACRADRLVFNVSSHYKMPDKDVGFLAKMLEILRLAPGEGLDFGDNPCQVQRVTLVGPPPAGPAAAEELPFAYQPENQTALEITLPRPVGPNESVTVELEFVLRLPPKQGRWGQWKGVTFLAQWLPVLAVHDASGWQPVPFIPWHQPFFNEAGVYTARVTLPAAEKLACTCSVAAEHDLGNGLRRVELAPRTARDFALFCSSRFEEFVGQAGAVRVRCLAFPEHAFYAREMVRIACEAIPVYAKWFGPFPYPEFTIVESYFGWNGNECGGLVMIDERVFGMPHLAAGFVDYLVSHETCHQWWYNVVGTNGYCETWMDEGLATYFAHRLLNQKCGRNDAMLHYPRGFGWLPNINREDYRHYSLYGTLARGENTATVQDMPRFEHLVNLNSMCYDKGAKIVGMIEERLGEAAFLDFMRHVYACYAYRILRVADFRRELEAYTGTSWDEFFKNWLYGTGLSDWCVERVKVTKGTEGEECVSIHPRDAPLYHATIFVRQKAEINEPTVVGICLDDRDQFPVRVPVLPGTGRLDLSDPPATVTALPGNRYRLDVTLPRAPTQVMVDPDQLQVDREPANNTWKRRVRVRVTPLYTLLDDTDITNCYDRWNVTIGPWLYGGWVNDPWFLRSEMFGARAGVYRTQQFAGGAYLAYRTDDQNVVMGVDGVWDHCLWPHAQVGFVAERALTDNRTPNGDRFNRAVLYGRYVFGYGDSLYLPPMHYVEAFGEYLENPLPVPRTEVPGADHFDHQTGLGVHYHLDYLTPYWNPEGGFRFDATYMTGIPIFGERQALNELQAQLSYVKCVPDLGGPGWAEPLTHWLSRTRLALRAFGAVGLPDKGEFFALGGGQRFRGFDLAERQGSLVWVGSAEWRVPLTRELDWDFCDHVIGVRGIGGALFYDAGNAYVRGHAVGDVAHALGGGLRVDLIWLGLLERSTFRFDVAKTVNANSPFQFWFGIQQPF